MYACFHLMYLGKKMNCSSKANSIFFKKNTTYNYENYSEHKDLT